LETGRFGVQVVHGKGFGFICRKKAQNSQNKALMGAKERKRHCGRDASKEIEDWNNTIERARGAGGFHGFHG
jgi:hypothetical protein